jgi:hypothetical protein
METAGGEERYTLEASYRETELDLRLSGSMMQLGRVMGNSYNARAEGDIRVGWNSPESFQAYMNLNSLTARIQDTELRASASAVLDSEEFTLSDLRVQYAGIEGVMPFLRVNRGLSLMETEASVRGGSGGRNLDLVFDMNASFGPSRSWLELGYLMDSFNGAIHVSQARLDTLSAEEPFDFLFSRKGPVMSLSGGPRNMIRLQADSGGDFYAGLSAPSPIRGSVIGTITSKTIDARASDLYIDLSSLWNFIPRRAEVVLSGGYVSADVEIRGPLGDPEFFGHARGNSVRVQVPRYISKDIMPIPFSVTIEGNEMSFGPVPATVGGGAGIVEGWFRFDRWVPNIFTMKIQVPQETPIPFSFDITGFLARGSAAGTLNLPWRILFLA